jgi:hypothetical protein
MQKTTVILVIILLSSYLLPAQIVDNPIPTTRQYGTQYRLRQLLVAYPSMQDDMAVIERFTTDFRYFGQIDSMSVAVVFHLLPLPAGAVAITEADIGAQLQRLALDFLAPEHPYLGQSYQHPQPLVDSSGHITGSETDYQNYFSLADKMEDFAGRAANPLIQFCRPALDPTGLPTNGVITVSGTPQVWNPDEEALFHSDKGGSDAWDPVFYCNVWVARLPDDMAGFAQLPGSPAIGDGVVIDDRYFARAAAESDNPFAAGKTLTHLLGSYLNLYELWNDFTPCADDRVEDTPVHNTSNFGLSKYEYRHLSTCAGNPVEMLSNLMDNAIDSVQYMFTWGQVMRMQATLALDGPRNKLHSTRTACAEGPHQNPGGETVDRDNATTDVAVNTVYLRIFPNPSGGPFTVQVESSGMAEAELFVTDALGAVRHRQPLLLQAATNRFSVNAAKDWKSGVFVVTLVTKDRTVSEKVLLNR